ncbi:MAG TPA: DUF4185 domain-containing protein [Kofleriaceae bacterium]|nr:DUF4185 domain-containing protein [Kofleriaceae bacterium]
MRWLLVLIAMGCGEVNAPPSPPGDGAAAMPPPPGFKTVSFQELGLIPQPSVIRGRDGARSASLWGKSVWTFNTTVLNQNDVEGRNWHNNSFAFTDDVAGSDGVAGLTETLDAAGAPVRILGPTQDEAAYNADHAGSTCPVTPCGVYYDSRPTSLVWDADRSRALMMYELAYFEPGKDTSLGRSVALWSALDGTPARPVVSQGEHPTMLFRGDEPGFGAAAAVADGYLHAFACAPDVSGFVSPCKLARVPLADVLVRSSWQFWDGAAFSARLEDAANLFTGHWFMTVVHSALLGRWLAVYAEPLSNAIVARSAAELSGPWSEQVLLFKTPPPSASTWTVDAALHDGYTENGGQTLYISYSRPDPNGQLFANQMVWVRVDIAAVP